MAVKKKTETAKSSVKKSTKPVVKSAKNQPPKNQAVKAVAKQAVKTPTKSVTKPEAKVGPTKALNSSAKKLGKAPLVKTAKAPIPAAGPTQTLAQPSKQDATPAKISQAIHERKSVSERKETEKATLSEVVNKVKAKGAAEAPVATATEGVVTSAEPEVEKKAVKPGPTRSEKLKIDRLLNENQPPAKKWQALSEYLKHMKPANYHMGEVFETRTPIHHKVLGWGYILESRENRIEVLFKEGVKTLIMNYKA